MSDRPAQERSDPDSDDRTEQVRLRQLARLGALFAGFAHEIRNPLSTIGLNLELVKEELADAKTPVEQRVLRRITTVESEVRRLQSILEQFLDYVRVPRLQTRSIDLAALIDDISAFVQPEMAEKGVTLRTFADPRLQPVEVDPQQLRAVLVNLLRNAREACGAGDQVMIETRELGDGIRLTVTDTGPGMDHDVREQALRPYFSTKKHGTGLGLPTVRRIVEQHGGTLRLESEPGRGTQFTIRLPRSPQPPGAATADDQDSEAAL